MTLADEHHLERPDSPERDKCVEAFVLCDQTRARFQLQREIIAKQTTLMRLVILILRSSFFPRLVRQALICPNLAMRVWIARAHHRAAILEYLHPVDERHRAEFDVLRDPGLNHLMNRCDTHAREGQIVSRRETGHTTDARLAFSHNQSVFIQRPPRRLRFERSEVIVKDKRGGVRRIARTASACVAGTQVACRIKDGQSLLYDIFYLSLPGTLSALWRDEHPLARERVVTTMRMFFQIKH